MSEPALRAATYDDVLAAPEHVVAELLDGRLWTHPRPAPRYAYAVSALAGELMPAFRRTMGRRGGWCILFEPELHLGDGVVVPDLAGWRTERLPGLPETAWFEVAPDWVCEALSPSTAAHDRAGKLPVYAGAGVRHAWLLDPMLETLEVLALDESRRLWVLAAAHRGSDVVRAEPFPAVELDLALLWPPRRTGD